LRKIVVFESDDWGSIRMPSVESFRKLEKAGLNLVGRDALRYNQNDTLASPEDLTKLFTVLSSVKDKNSNYAVFTPISIVGNPDFQKIKDSCFSKYYFEPFTETLKKYSGREGSFDLWKEGIARKIFVPQMHGREHLNISAWMRALRDNDKYTLLAFEEGCWGFLPDQSRFPGVDFQAAFLFKDLSELDFQKKIIEDGLNLFESLFGYRAEYFVPPNGPFNNSNNKTLFENGIKYRSVSKIQSEPFGNGRYKKVIHWLGQKEGNGLKYITRNCFFEPCQSGKDWVDSCMNDINISFRWGKPAIISTHRVNYIGALNPTNRVNGLKQLSILLGKIIKKWPEVEFITTPELGALINGGGGGKKTRI
jgi:hypothetical protein